MEQSPPLAADAGREHGALERDGLSLPFHQRDPANRRRERMAV